MLLRVVVRGGVDGSPGIGWDGEGFDGMARGWMLLWGLGKGGEGLMGGEWFGGLAKGLACYCRAACCLVSFKQDCTHIW